MGAREKILVGLMVLAVLYGAFELLIGPPEKSGPDEKSGQEIESARKMAEKIDTRIDRAQLTAIQKNTLKLAAQQWERDPFYVLPEEKSLAANDSGSRGNFGSLKYTGYLEVGDRKMAIINGVEYRMGERLEKGSGVVKQITPGRVIIESERTGERSAVPYSESRP